MLDIEDGTEDGIKSIKITTDYLMAVENRLNQGVKNTNDMDSYFDMNGLDKNSQTLLVDINYLLKEKLLDENKKSENYNIINYFYHMLQSVDNVPEIKYILGYMSKTTGFIKPDEYAFDEEKQFIFEGILFSALTLYNNGGASRSKLRDSHKRFVQEIEQKNEEKLSRTQQLNTIKIQALRELGYDSMTEENAAEVLEKIAEIETRKV